MTELAAALMATNVLTVLSPLYVTNTVTVVQTNTVTVTETIHDDRISATTNLVTRTFRLHNANAEDLATRFNNMWTGDFGSVWKIAKVAQAFPEANSLMVTAPRPVMEACEAIVNDVDVEPRQVYIEARFVELSSTASHKLGIDWSMLNAMKGTVSLGGGIDTRTIGNAVQSYTRSVSQGGENVNYSLAGSTSTREHTTTTTTGADGTKSVVETVASTSTDSGRDGGSKFFTGTINFDDMYLILSALEGEYDVRTFSNPKIIVSSGKRAVVDMTTKYPNVSIAAKKTINNNNESVDLDMKMAEIPGEDKLMFAKEAFFSWGISLEVTPRVTTNGNINVAIVPTISAKTGEVTAGTAADGTGGKGGDTYSAKYPIIDVQRLVTDFSMQNGMTAVIGGLSKTVEEQIDSGIPFLRNIWWIGDKLFGGKSRQKVQKEIIVFVTVGYADPTAMQADVGLPKNAIMGREYTEGRRKEPGDRTSGVAGVTSLDLRPLEEQAADPQWTNRNDSAEGRFYLPFSKKR